MHRGIVGFGCTGTLTIDGFLLNTAAWDITDLTPLWIETTMDGEDVPLPGVDGAVPFQRFMQPASFALAMKISGDVDELGVDYANAMIGMETNLASIKAAIVTPVHTGDGTRAAVLTKPSGATMSADVHVLGIRTSGIKAAGTRQSFLPAVLQLSIPMGEFT